MAHILVVDDEPDARGYVGRFLEKMGHTVAMASTGREALRVLMSEKPDLTVLDVRMPEMTGVQLLEVLRSYVRWYGLPVIVVSAHMTPEDVARMRELGVVYVFHKADYHLSDLANAVAEATGAGGGAGGEGAVS